MADRGRMINGRPVSFVNERALARFPNPVRHYVHRVIQRNFCPLFRARRAIFHFCLAPIMREQLVRSRAFRAKIPLANWTLGIALDRNQLAVFVINELSATDSAVRANRAGDACAIGARMHRASFVRHRLQPSPVRPPANLTNERPFREQRSERFMSFSPRLSGHFLCYPFFWQR